MPELRFPRFLKRICLVSALISLRSWLAATPVFSLTNRFCLGSSCRQTSITCLALLVNLFKDRPAQTNKIANVALPNELQQPSWRFFFVYLSNLVY